jgi:hypothetical protein
MYGHGQYGKGNMHPMLNIRIFFTNYDIITYFVKLAFCSEHFISIKHRKLATFNINKKINSGSQLYACNVFSICHNNV